MAEMTTREAAAHLGVNQSRLRALIAAGSLTGRRVGSQWLVDVDSLDRQKELTAAGATGRAMAQHVAWAAADLADVGNAAWLSASEKSRLRRRLRDAASVDVLRRWLTHRCAEAVRYRVSDRDLDALLAQEGVVRTGVSAADSYRLGLGAGGAGEAYLSASVAKDLIRDFYLIQNRTGNLTFRIVGHDLHLATARHIDGQRVCTRLVVGADLADSLDSRTRTAGRELLRAVLSEQQDR
jgi:excisionase family DNA binding protein